jgi:hypothetical protein
MRQHPTDLTGGSRVKADRRVEMGSVVSFSVERDRRRQQKLEEQTTLPFEPVHDRWPAPPALDARQLAHRQRMLEHLRGSKGPKGCEGRFEGARVLGFEGGK